MANTRHIDDSPARGGKGLSMKPKDLRASDLSDAIGRASDFASVAIKLNASPEDTFRLDLSPSDYLTSDGTDEGTPLTVAELIGRGEKVATPGRKPSETDGSTS